VYLNLSAGGKKVVDMFFISKSSECGGDEAFCVGDDVLYQKRDAVVVAAISNDRVQIRIKETRETFVVLGDDLAKSLKCTDEATPICVGDRVLVQSSPADVLGLYSNGMAKIRTQLEGREYWVTQKSLSKTLRCVKSICVGQKVHYGTMEATVREIYSNGTARVAIGLLAKEYLVRLDSLRP
jgi:hypothetical protein